MVLVFNICLLLDFVYVFVLGFFGEVKDSDELNRYVFMDFGIELDLDNIVVYIFFFRFNVFNGLGIK